MVPTALLSSTDPTAANMIFTANNIAIPLKLLNNNCPQYSICYQVDWIKLPSLESPNKCSPCRLQLDGICWWIRQDQLILHAITTFMNSTVITMLGNVKNSKEVWDIITMHHAFQRTFFSLYKRDQICHWSPSRY